MENQPQLVQLEKTLLNIEGLGRQLYPELDLMSAAKPVLDDWRKKQMDIKGLVKKLQKDAPELRETLERLPEVARKLLEERPDHNQSVLTSMDIVASFKRLYLGMIGMGFFIGGILLLAIKEISFWPGWVMVAISVIIILTTKPK
jgi:predicted unusual protein kinase regulating ubiquinone biosynthesis (AarF/ABC1/UbiB family)